MAEDGKGAGGKLTKRSFRSSRASSTPYSRPAAAENKKSGWFSKLVATPASKIFPSLFLSSKHEDEDEDQREEDGDGDEALTEIPQELAPVSTLTSNNHYLEPDEFGARAKTTEPKVDYKNDGHAGNTSNNAGIADIEQQLQQKKFSVDEANRLIEFLRSRTTDLPENDGHVTRSQVEASEVSLVQKNVRKSLKEDCGVQFDSRMTQKSSEHFQFKANDVTSSPVEIAKAYMDSRALASGYDCRTGRLKTEKNSFYTDNGSSKLSFTPLTKSPTCWPGAVVQNDREYYSPQRVGTPLHPRTPYPVTLFSKSTPKFQINSQRPDRSSTKRSSTQDFGRRMMTPRTNSVTDDRIASIHPTHHMHQKNFASAFKGAGPSSSTERTLEDGSSKSGFYKFQPADVKNEVTKLAVDSTPVHPQSSLMARKILEHLDRTVPSPKEKLEEIKLARMRATPMSDIPVVDRQRDKADMSISADAQKTSNEIDQPQPQTNKRGIFGLARDTTAKYATFQTSENLTKSTLSQVSIAAKPSERLTTPNNGFFSFTFPSPAASALFSEQPPTPTMGSPASTSRTLEAGEEGVPLYSFGSTNSVKRLDFSLGSAVDASDIDVSTPSFKFGTENKSRLPFKPIGGDAICY